METVETGAKPVKTERDIDRVYRQVNEAWQGIPRDTRVPDEIVRKVVQSLYMLIMEERFRGGITVKHRGRSHASSSWITVNTYRGWWLMVHDLAHAFHRMKNPGLRQHDPKQALIERAMIEEVVGRGWATGPEVAELVELTKEDEPVERPKPRTILEVKLERAKAALDRWERKHKRAENAMAKLRSQIKRWEKRVA